MKLSLEEVDAKKSLRIIWIVEGALLFIMSFAVLLIWPDRVASLIELVPYLFGLIALQATGAIGGSSLKRWTESLKIKAANGGKNDLSDSGIAAGDCHGGMGLDGAGENAPSGTGSGGGRRQTRQGAAEDAGGIPT